MTIQTNRKMAILALNKFRYSFYGFMTQNSRFELLLTLLHCTATVTKVAILHVVNQGYFVFVVYLCTETKNINATNSNSNV